ncbi:NAD(P)H-binding protein [Cohnella rhizosphaerae]|uniref:NAD(P)H-binding protein n=1 Tax=Cohnella rhizosphaerae TaxID=1457232 RepID=A0A9X4KUT8_9BACL|nr:NAD(P)H-binding protein [Cohnella rhizosphaerae]MDG0809319.1 NAD(P)H-binding protein [Cohnella rhizosphaerae]
MKIVMTGATGHLGSLVLEELLRRMPASRIAIVTRRPEEAEKLRGRGIEVRYGDYDEPASLQAAFKDADRLLFVSSPLRDEEARLRQHRAAVEGAEAAKVGRIVYTSIAYAERGRLPLHATHLATERLIRESGLDYTILRNAYYMDIVEMLGWRAALTGGVLLSPPGDWTLNTAAREDLAAAAATVLTESGHEGRVYELTASRPWRLDDLARALSERSGRPVVHRVDPAMKGMVYGLLPLSETAAVSPDLRRLVGAPLRGLKDWLADQNL